MDQSVVVVDSHNFGLKMPTFPLVTIGCVDCADVGMTVGWVKASEG